MKYITLIVLSLLLAACEVRKPTHYCPVEKVCHTETRIIYMQVGDVPMFIPQDELVCECPVQPLPCPDAGCR